MVLAESLNAFESWFDDTASDFFKRAIWDVTEPYFEVAHL